MIIAQISDTHIVAKTAEDPEGPRRAENLSRCVADINRQGVDAVIHTGDSVHHGKEEDYAHLREIVEGLDPPFYLVPGNRDRHDVLRGVFDHHRHLPSEGGHLHYAIDDQPLRLLGLDSVNAGERKGIFCAARRAWLDATLGERPDRPTILFMHHPPFDIVPHFVGGYRRQQEAHDLADLVSRHPQVVRLLCGHVHRQHRTPWGGAIAATMPSVAVDLRKGVDPSIGDAPLYALHDFSDPRAPVTRMQVVTH